MCNNVKVVSTNRLRHVSFFWSDFLQLYCSIASAKCKPSVIDNGLHTLQNDLYHCLCTLLVLFRHTVLVYKFIGHSQLHKAISFRDQTTLTDPSLAYFFYLFLWMLCRAGQKSGFSSPHFYISSVHHRYKNLQPVRAAAPPCLAHAFYKISNNHIINRCMLKVISIYKYILWSLLYKRFFVYLQHNIYKMVLNS